MAEVGAPPQYLARTVAGNFGASPWSRSLRTRRANGSAIQLRRALVPLPPLPHRNFPCRPPGRSGHRRYTAKMRTSFGHAQGPSACALAGAALSLASPPSPSKGGANAWRNGRTIWIVDAHRDDG